jgi:hypothetical protein
MTKEFKKRMLFLLELDFLNGQIEKLELKKEELREQFSLNSVSQQRELLLAYEQSKCPETWWMSKNQAENEVNDFIANNCG